MNKRKSDNKGQHYVPKSYLEAWCDKTTPSTHEPYVWLFPKSGGKPINKAPRNVFKETDFYTVITQEGERDLHIENNLSRVESNFIALRRNKLDRRIGSLSLNERVALCMFTMAMYGRTKSRAEQLTTHWGRIVEMGDKMQQTVEKMTPEARKRMSIAFCESQINKNNERISLDEARVIAEKPIQNNLSSIVTCGTDFLYQVPFIILQASWPDRFITSDNPCCFFDGVGIGGISSPTIEITLPLSPSLLIFFGHYVAKEKMYVSAAREVVAHFNQRTRHFADKYYVSNSLNFLY